ncbi:ABC transporter permease [Chitinophaga sp.]|uniref:ABC transporter permease n=1 Tax=Chitinophaga sp. TaxID=1869181 RepID=UPI002B9154EE|nr:ABC transporter permease [Chitinophaga sp.]HWV66132.1 ABC transporter permease [Chitinophaga sp.]
MLTNYFKTAVRTLKKDRFYTAINIVGLALATAGFLFIINYVRFENSYENFYKKAGDIYRITLDLYKGAEYVVTDCETHPPMAPMLKKQFPEVVDYVRVQNLQGMTEIKSGNKIYKIAHAYAVDPSMFTMFGYTFSEGSSANIFQAPYQAVLTESLARRMFSGSPALGKTFRDGDELFTVSGVIKDVPANTHLKIELLISFSTMAKRGFDLNSFNGNNNYTYVQLAPHTDLTVFNRKLKKFSDERLKNDRYVAEPMKDIHLHSHKSFEPEENGDIKTVQFMMVVAVLVLLIGSINYINLSTARAADRTRETGMRKVLGGSRLSLIKQFMTETLLINLLASVIALGMIQVLMPAYIKLTGHPVDTDFFHSSFFWGIMLALFVFNCLLSGIYPALVLSAVKPVSITGRISTMSAKGVLFRKVLVSAQFAAALIVLAASLIVYRQLSYMRHQELGLNAEQILVLRIPRGQGSAVDSMRRLQSQAFMNQVSMLPQVVKISNTSSIPGVSLHELSTFSGISQYGSDQGLNYNYYAYGIDTGFLPVMNIKLLAGENFRADTSSRYHLIISKSASRLFGFTSPEDAIGKKITLTMTDEKYSIITGVIDDYHQQSLKGALLPMIHWYNDSNGAFYAIKLNTADIGSTIKKIAAAWKSQYPEYAFDYHFFDELYDQQYKAEMQFGKIVQLFSGFTLFITCLGILGLTAYSITKRSKEIGIRKVLGASVANIVNLLTRDFVKLVCIGIVIATPLTWYIMNRWLQDYAYRIQIQWWMFAVAGLIALFVALLTVGVQSVKAALANPAKSLKSE